MAVIENAGTSPEALAAWRASMRTMDPAELLAQQLVQRGAEHALAELQKHGPTPENCASMLASLREGLFEIHAVATERGIPLAGYDAPVAGEQPAPDCLTCGDRGLVGGFVSDGDGGGGYDSEPCPECYPPLPKPMPAMMPNGDRYAYTADHMRGYLDTYRATLKTTTTKGKKP